MGHRIPAIDEARRGIGAALQDLHELRRQFALAFAKLERHYGDLSRVLGPIGASDNGSEDVVDGGEDRAAGEIEAA